MNWFVKKEKTNNGSIHKRNYDALFFHIQSKTHFKIHVLKFLKKGPVRFFFDNFEEILHQLSPFEREKTDLKF